VRWEAICFWTETVDAWIARGELPAGTDAMAHYGFDPQPILPGSGFALPLSGPPVQERLCREDGHTQIWENDLGQVWRIRTDGASMPQWLRFPVESARDWQEKIAPRLRPDEQSYGDLEARSPEFRDNDDPNGLWLYGLYAFWRNYWGEVNCAYAFYDEPETLHAMARTWLEVTCTRTTHILERVRADYLFLHEDMAFKNGPLIGPRLFDEFMMPYYRELLSHLRGHGMHRFMIDSDGNNGPLLQKFIAAGINGLYPFEIAAGCDPIAFRREHPDFFIWGALDKRVLNGSKADIAREVYDKVPVLWASGRYVPSLDHSCPHCPRENFEYYLELVRELARG
jgi:uroporphyrinogen decarboxylase